MAAGQFQITLLDVAGHKPCRAIERLGGGVAHGDRQDQLLQPRQLARLCDDGVQEQPAKP